MERGKDYIRKYMRMCGGPYKELSNPLEEYSTRRLLVMLNGARKRHEDGFVEQLKAVLATREHIPNKREGKIQRRMKAQGRVR